jgi:hypothetical protein
VALFFTATVDELDEVLVVCSKCCRHERGPGQRRRHRAWLRAAGHETRGKRQPVVADRRGGIVHEGQKYAHRVRAGHQVQRGEVAAACVHACGAMRQRWQRACMHLQLRRHRAKRRQRGHFAHALEDQAFV